MSLYLLFSSIQILYSRSLSRGVLCKLEINWYQFRATRYTNLTESKAWKAAHKLKAAQEPHHSTIPQKGGPSAGGTPAYPGSPDGGAIYQAFNGPDSAIQSPDPSPFMGPDTDPEWIQSGQSGQEQISILNFKMSEMTQNKL
jgi:hypothetical protein